jgi:hypothetical protein
MPDHVRHDGKGTFINRLQLNKEKSLQSFFEICERDITMVRKHCIGGIFLMDGFRDIDGVNGGSNRNLRADASSTFPMTPILEKQPNKYQ